MSIEASIYLNRPRAEVDAMLASLLENFPDLDIRAEVRDASAPLEPEVGIPEADAVRIATELRAELEKTAPSVEVIICNLEEGCGLQVLLHSEHSEAAVRSVFEIAISQGAPVNLRNLGGGNTHTS